MKPAFQSDGEQPSVHFLGRQFKIINEHDRKLRTIMITGIEVLPSFQVKFNMKNVYEAKVRVEKKSHFSLRLDCV